MTAVVFSGTKATFGDVITRPSLTLVTVTLMFCNAVPPRPSLA